MMSASEGSEPGSHRVASRHGFGATDIGLIAMAAIWGINFTVVKAGTSAIPPLAFNGIRVLVAAVVLQVVAIAIAGVSTFPSRRDALALLGLGVLGNGLYQLLFIAGLSLTR